MNGAALSVMFNISEGFLRRRDKETSQFLRYSFASNGELKAGYYAARAASIRRRRDGRPDRAEREHCEDASAVAGDADATNGPRTRAGTKDEAKTKTAYVFGLRISATVLCASG